MRLASAPHLERCVLSSGRKPAVSLQAAWPDSPWRSFAPRGDGELTASTASIRVVALMDLCSLRACRVRHAAILFGLVPPSSPTRRVVAG